MVPHIAITNKKWPTEVESHLVSLSGHLKGPFFKQQSVFKSKVHYMLKQSWWLLCNETYQIPSSEFLEDPQQIFFCLSLQHEVLNTFPNLRERETRNKYDKRQVRSKFQHILGRMQNHYQTRVIYFCKVKQNFPARQIDRKKWPVLPLWRRREHLTTNFHFCLIYEALIPI